ncbi:MAG: hypothetical protein U1A77_13955 [Pirellulales bacterium]
MAADVNVVRRSFLAGASASVVTAMAASAWAKPDAVAIGVAVAPPTQNGIVETANHLESPQLEYHDFAARVGESFRCRDASGADILLRLERVAIQPLTPYDIRRHSPPESKGCIESIAFPLRQTPFTLFFSTSRNMAPGDSLVRLSHPRLGDFDLFLQQSSAASSSSGTRMVAVFG